MQTAAPHTSLTILVVEDNPIDVSLIRSVLTAHGLTYHLQVIENGEHALNFVDHLSQHAEIPCPDIVLLDLNLPQLPGMEILQRLKAVPRCASIRVVIMTAYVHPTELTEARALGADAFFEKPFSLTTFMQLGDLIKALVFDTSQGESEGASQA